MNEQPLSFEKHIVIETSKQSAISILSENCPQVSKQKLKLAMQYGAVWLTNSQQKSKTVRVRRAKKTLNVGDQLHIYYDDNILFSEVEPARLVADEGEYSVWDKPCGMFSQGTKWGDHSSVARWVELFGLKQNKLELRPSFLVHRLDRATSGLILIAHSKNSTKQLTRLFEQREIKKQYIAYVKGKLPSEFVLTELNDDIDEKQALTIIRSSDYNVKSNQSRLLVDIKTGRKHQIRRHLLGIGFPVVGDRLYGDVNLGSSLNQNKELSKSYKEDLKLQSCYLDFKSPFDQTEKIYSLI